MWWVQWRSVFYMDLHECMRRGVQCGMRYSKVGNMCTREESWVCWDEVPVVAVGGGYALESGLGRGWD